MASFVTKEHHLRRTLEKIIQLVDDEIVVFNELMMIVEG